MKSRKLNVPKTILALMCFVNLIISPVFLITKVPADLGYVQSNDMLIVGMIASLWILSGMYSKAHAKKN